MVILSALNSALLGWAFSLQERMTEFSARKNRALEAHLDAEQRQKELQSQTSSASLHSESIDSHSPTPQANSQIVTSRMHSSADTQPCSVLSTDKSEVAVQPKTENLM